MRLRTAIHALTVLLTLTLLGCGGGGGGGFEDRSYKIEFEVSSDTLPVNILARDPCMAISCWHTVEVNIRVTDSQGNAAPQGTEVGVDMTPISHGYLTRLDDGETDDINEFSGRDDEGNIVARMGQMVVPTSGGLAKAFFTSGENPGPVRLTASVTTPTGTTVERSMTLHVGSTAGSGMPVDAILYGDPGVIFAQGLNDQSQSSGLVALILDERMGAVDDPPAGVNNVLVEIISGPDSGEYLIGRNAAGNVMRGNALLLSTRNGKAEFDLVAGLTPGIVAVRAIADGWDNDADNMITEPVTAAAAIVVTTAFSGTPLMIMTEDLPDSSVGDVYAALLEASGGVPPYTWGVTQGSLPFGLNLDPSGVISGNSNWPGNFCFVARVTDSTTPIAERASREFCINVDGIRPLTFITASVPRACVGESYAVALGANGGEPPYSWDLDYTPPAGASDWVELSGSGILFGTPEAGDVGAYQLGVSVSDGNETLTRTLQLIVENCP